MKLKEKLKERERKKEITCNYREMNGMPTLTREENV